MDWLRFRGDSDIPRDVGSDAYIIMMTLPVDERRKEMVRGFREVRFSCGLNYTNLVELGDWWRCGLLCTLEFLYLEFTPYDMGTPPSPGQLAPLLHFLGSH